MNRTKLKNYAPQARRDFIQAVTDRAAYFGLTATKVEPVTQKGDSVLIGGTAFPRKVGEQRKRLEERVRQHGFQQTMEALAYTWFNRLVAIRFMELHDYLENGEGGASYRVLSNPDKDKPTPEILEKAEHVTLESLDRQKVIDLKLEGTKEVELYRLLLIAECNALNAAMPFLFERIDDETELVLPDNLLHSDSLIRKLVNEIDENDWQQVEIVGWLYQFYISEEKRRVDGYTKNKAVLDADIAAKTELFTPNWIVKFLVQNTLGRQWLATYPQSALRQQMAYYIEPAEQTPEVQGQLDTITPTSLNPEELTLLDPACGSGHILVEGYDLCKAIYQERGYRAKDIPRLILQKNLFGLEIDDRAAQLAAFALMMKARADDRRIFASQIKPSVLAIQESNTLDARQLTTALNSPLVSGDGAGQKADISQAQVARLIDLFQHGKTLGSLIRVPENLIDSLSAIFQRACDVAAHGGLFEQSAGMAFIPVVAQARMLATKYRAIAMNPPYMGGRSMNARVKALAEEEYPHSKADTYAMFIERAGDLALPHGVSSLVTMHSWMFLSTYEEMRQAFLADKTLLAVAHLGPRAFPEISGEVVKSQIHSALNTHIAGYKPTFFRLLEGDSEQKRTALLAQQNRFVTGTQDDFGAIPGSPFAYWINESVRRAFRDGTPLSKIAHPTGGMTTGNNELFLRCWWEVSHHTIGFGYRNANDAKRSGRKWFPYNKGGTFRKWYGNNELIVNWWNDGAEIIAHGRAYPRSRSYYFRPAITWTATSSSPFAARHSDAGFVFDAKGSSCFAKEADHHVLLAFLSSRAVDYFLEILNPTLEVQVGDVGNLPILPEIVADETMRNVLKAASIECIEIARRDWDSHETSWDFLRHPMTSGERDTSSTSNAFADWHKSAATLSRRLALLQEGIDQQITDLFRLHEALATEPPVEPFLYQPNRNEDTARLISYAIGCMMGRYSLDKPGLIYAHRGNVGFDPSQYKTFPADDDGIVPLLDADWGIRDDAANRIVEFISEAWPREHLEENLKFIAESLDPTKDEHSRDTIRRYLATGFYKDHLRWYKRRPIYWLFSSGKQRAFQCLVYLHRYHEGTLARMRTEYVIPLQGKIAARIEQLEGDKNKATSTSHRKKLQKEQDDLKKQQAELFAFDEKLKHAADQKIALDLDDGVKVNYGKFGDLLAEVRAVTGGADE